MTGEDLRRLNAYGLRDLDERDLALGMQSALDVAYNRARAAEFAKHLTTLTPTQRRRHVDVFLENSR